MKAKCPHCKGSGQVEVDFAQGELYSRSCTICGAYAGGCIVGGDSPLKEPPTPKNCLKCNGPTVWKLEVEAS